MATKPLTNQFTLEELAKFLVKGKRNGYAASGKEFSSRGPGFTELRYSEGNWDYVDGYVGFNLSLGQGQEIVRFKKYPVWAMAYHGGMLPGHDTIETFAEKTFKFLKKALMLVEESKPFRGPELYDPEDVRFRYVNLSEGDIKNFKGTECVFHTGYAVHKIDYLGGLMVPKEIICKK
jgi:hypothetical protein